MVLNLAFNSTLEEHIGNTLGTHCEHEGNNGKMKKKILPPYHPKLPRK
jgi:hypothetical protein